MSLSCLAQGSWYAPLDRTFVNRPIADYSRITGYSYRHPNRLSECRDVPWRPPPHWTRSHSPVMNEVGRPSRNQTKGAPIVQRSREGHLILDRGIQHRAGRGLGGRINPTCVTSPGQSGQPLSRSRPHHDFEEREKQAGPGESIVNRIHVLLASSGLVLHKRNVPSRDNVSNVLSRGDIACFLAGYPLVSHLIRLCISAEYCSFYGSFPRSSVASCFSPSMAKERRHRWQGVDATRPSATGDLITPRLAHVTTWETKPVTVPG